MTILFPDVSQYNALLDMSKYPAVIARAAIGTAKDSKYDQNKANAAKASIRFAAYAFLNSPSLGVSVNAQADFAYSVIGAGVPVMLDLEPNRGTCASLGDGMAWVQRFRSNGGICRLCYLPKWMWSTPRASTTPWGWGSADLRPLAALGVGLVASNYTSYSDSGSGWAPYGNVAPVQWQFTDNYQGTGADGNAFKGTVDQWWSLMTGDDNMWTDKQWDRAYAILVNVESLVTSGFIGVDRDAATDSWQGINTPLDAKKNAVQAALAGLTGMQSAVAPTQDQVNAAVLAALKDPAVLAAIGAAFASHVHVD